jgi:hypothetical protein
MTQDFCYHLNLPFAIDVNWLQEQQSKISGHDRIVNILMPIDRVDCQLLLWCASVGIELLQAELIYTPAGGWGKPHIDLGNFSDLCKINWVFGGQGSKMNWYLPKKNDCRGTTLKSNTVGTFINVFHTDDLLEVYSTEITGPALMHVGIPHNVCNRNSPERWAITTTYKDRVTGQVLTFQQAKHKLKDYIDFKVG